jgi:hypothetical protein
MYQRNLLWPMLPLLMFISALCFAAERQLFIAKGACPFECCTYGIWSVGKDTSVYERPDMDSRILATLAAGDMVEVVTGEVHVVPGIARITAKLHRSAQSLDRQREVEILDYQGEGYSSVRQGNVIQQVKIARSKRQCLNNPDPRYCWVDLIEEPDTRWWVQLESVYPGSWVNMESGGLKALDSCS